LILAGVATRREIEEWWSIDDVADANDALDAKLEAERVSNQRSAARAKKGR
jgi:hypothetical protein